MGDMGDAFRAYKDYKREQKRKYQNEKMPKEMALMKGIAESLDSFNFGEHWVVNIKGNQGMEVVDWYPSTNKWKVRNKGSGYGVGKLKKYLGVRQ